MHGMNTTYTPVAKGFHWSMAVLIVGALALGLYMHDLPLSPQKLKLYSWHKWLGVTLFVMVWLRLAWRVTHPPPPPPETVKPGLQRLARGGHALLYVLMIALPLSGWLMSSAKGFQTVWFGVVPIPDLIGRNNEVGDFFQAVHKALTLVLMLTLAGHIAAALWHHFVLRDDTLRRIR